ncbi:MAG: hypothetical protein JWQ15_1487 [Marmoricola sp.]|nr:hypothetical protein [Marmoricola sp.]
MALGVAGVAGLTVSACTGGDSVSGERQPKRPAALAPDVAVATSALAEIRAARTAASSTLSRFPASRSRLAPLVGMHQAHEASLANAVPDRAGTAGTTAAPAPYVVPLRSDAAFRRLAAREQQLRTTLESLALEARSGDFARLLASMAAGVGQRLVGWPT